jgi:hypothetical protein
MKLNYVNCKLNSKYIYEIILIKSLNLKFNYFSQKYYFIEELTISRVLKILNTNLNIINYFLLQSYSNRGIKLHKNRCNVNL